MPTASHNVEALSPEAFAPPPQKRSLFPCAPGYSRNSVPPVGRDRRPLGGHAPSCEVLRWPLSLFRGPTQSCFYPRPCAWEPVHDSGVKVLQDSSLTGVEKWVCASAGEGFSSPG